MTTSQAIKLARTLADLSEPERVTVLAFAVALGERKAAAPIAPKVRRKRTAKAAKPEDASASSAAAPGNGAAEATPEEPRKRGRPRKAAPVAA